MFKISYLKSVFVRYKPSLLVTFIFFLKCVITVMTIYCLCVSGNAMHGGIYCQASHCGTH